MKTDGLKNRRRRWWRRGEIVGDVLTDQVDGDLVVRASRDDHVGELLGRDTELFKCRLDKLDVLVENLVHITPELVNILQNSLGKPTVSIRINEQLHVEQIPNLGWELGLGFQYWQHHYLWIVERENAFKEDHINLIGIDSDVFIDHARVELEIIDRNVGNTSIDDPY